MLVMPTATSPESKRRAQVRPSRSYRRSSGKSQCSISTGGPSAKEDICKEEFRIRVGANAHGRFAHDPRRAERWNGLSVHADRAAAQDVEVCTPVILERMRDRPVRLQERGEHARI